MRRFWSLLTLSRQFFTEVIFSLIRGNGSLLAGNLRRYLFQTTCIIDTDTYIRNLKNFYAGEGSAIYHGSYILNSFGEFHLGKNSHLGAFCFVNVCYGRVEIGDHVAIGPGTKIIVYSNHYEAGKKVTDTRLTADIRIGNNVFIGANCVLLPGTTIEDNVILAAGAVAKGILDANSIYGGTPCRKLRSGWND